MALTLGSTSINGLYLGTTAINKMYLGAVEVFSGLFNPATLFANGEEGTWYDPSDLSTVWADTAGTTPASVDGAVARIDDKSGNGNHATQSTASARPILRQSGGLTYLEFDGVDDVLQTSAQVITGADFSVWAGVKSNDLSQGSRYMVQGINAGLGRIMLYSTRTSADMKMAVVLANSTYVDTPVQDINAHIYTTLRETGGALETRFDGTVSGNRTGVPQTVENDVLKIGGIEGVEFYDGNIYGLIVRGASSDATEIDNTEAYMAAKSGVTLP